MKQIIYFFIFVFTSPTWANQEFPYAYFSPQQGKIAFSEIYKLVENSKDIKMTLYSWSDQGLLKAFEIALKKNASVRIILHPALAKTPSMKSRYDQLEEMGAQIKVTTKNMHEKMLLVDNGITVNSSANMSSGAMNKYDENFVFHNEESVRIYMDYEFSLLWNTAIDWRSPGDSLAKEIAPPKIVKQDKLPIQFYSSSMNFKTQKTKDDSVAYTKGQFVKLTLPNPRPWTVRDKIVNEINQAEKTIYAGLNHFYILEIATALFEAMKRGVDVRLAVDNQEFKTNSETADEMTPKIVKWWSDWRGDKVAPVRVKFYSHAPSPKYWFLNHHKFLLIDYGLPKAVLISGSYNLSETAEHNQFDNMIFYFGKTYQKIQKQFLGEFNKLWMEGRTSADLPREEVMAQFFELKGDSYPIHVKVPVALTWQEALNLRKKIIEKTKNGSQSIFSNLFRKRDCMYYNPKSLEFWGGC